MAQENLAANHGSESFTDLFHSAVTVWAWYPGCNTHRFRTAFCVRTCGYMSRTWIEGRQGLIPRGYPHPKSKSRRVLYPPPTPHYGAATKSRRVLYQPPAPHYGAGTKSRRVLYPPPTPHQGAGTKSRRVLYPPPASHHDVGKDGCFTRRPRPIMAQEQGHGGCCSLRPRPIMAQALWMIDEPTKPRGPVLASYCH